MSKTTLKTVLQNRERLAANIGIPLSHFTIPKQIHSGTVTIITEEMKGYGAADLDTAVEATDAMITDVPRLCLTVLAADCVLVLFFDPQKKSNSCRTCRMAWNCETGSAKNGRNLKARIQLQSG